ncbi:hypothetical protein PHYBOEH_011679 [Phytophthora boehmeriae]|uniref:Calx-beta domain-containing protein n=1 Tax=Phytophthora boehmeriae TaxID=109152 RepID=A0A8T1X289_9STRA|nr:hypothetical protein PHYBOEH_011679 [Phytophthora boehmeriae]
MVISRRWLLRALVVIRVLGGANGLANGRFQFSQAIYSTTEDFGVAYITVQRSLGFDGRAAVYVSTIPGAGNAVPGRDFRPLFNDSLVWQDGEDFEKALYVPIYNDGKPQETVKDFTLRLHDADGAEINLERSQTQIVLVPPSNLFPGSFSFETSTVSVAEDNTLSIPVLWMAGTTSTANVQFEFVCQSACLPGDFTLISPKPQLLTWKRDDYPSTSTARKQNIVLSVPDDGLYEQSETFLVRLVLVEPVEGDAVSTGTIGEIGEIIVTIAGPNDVRPGTLQFESDCFPDCACNNYSIIAGGTARVIIQRRRGDNGAVSVSVASQDGTAFAGVDYVSMQQTLSWDDGDTSDRQILVTSLARADPRLPSRRIALVLRNNQGAPLGGIYASTAYVDITTPTDVFVGDVNFATREPLDSVLRFPDLSFIPLATRNTSSRLQLCPRIVTTKVGVLSIAIQRNFNDFPVPASVRVNTIDGTATAGVDFEPLTNAIVSWANSDSEVKNVNVKLLTPPTYDPHPRSFQLHLTDARGAIVGECNVLDVELTGIAQGAHVVSFDLDMAIGTLTLRMSLPVQASTLDITNLLLQSERELKNGPTFAFSSQSTTTNSGDGTIIVLNIGASDLNALKQTFGLAKTTASTFLSVGIGLFRYVLNKCESTGIHACPAGITEVIPKDAALTVGTFTADTIPPTLLSYSFDLSRRLLKLRFSESVNFAKLNIEALTLAETTAGFDVYQLSSATTRLFAPQPDPLSGATLTDTNRLPPDYTFLTLQLGSADTAALANFGSGQIGIKRANTFLGIDSTFIADFATNPLAPSVMEDSLHQLRALHQQIVCVHRAHSVLLTNLRSRPVLLE